MLSNDTFFAGWMIRPTGFRRAYYLGNCLKIADWVGAGRRNLGRNRTIRQQRHRYLWLLLTTVHLDRLTTNEVTTINKLEF